MELKIMSPQESGFVKEIKWNNEELKAEIAEKMQEYKSLVFTEETMKDAKADRAKLNKLKTAFEDERKRIKKLCMEPYETFEKQVKEVIALIEEPILLIDKQIKEVEEQKKLEKKGQILEYYEEHIGTLKGIIPFDRLFRPEYLNVSKSMKSIAEEISGNIQRINSDLDTIEGFRSKYELQIKDVYLRTLDLSTAMQEKARLEEVEQRLEQRRQEEERKARETIKTGAPEKEPVREQEEPEERISKAEQQVAAEDVPVFQMDFRVWGTKEQLMKLRQYLMDNHMKFGKVE